MKRSRKALALAAARPALLVAMHYCSGSASAIFSGYAADYVRAADQYGYIIVFPEATRSGTCFDVYTSQALTRGGGSDPVGIISMVNYTKQRYNVDRARVYATGFSSGAMMTNVMTAEYPDVFAAGSAFMGVPATCFATTGGSTWNSQCSGGNITKTAQQWGDAARAMNPGYSGRYPRMQLWHGTTDTTLNYRNFAEEIKQWTNLNAVSATPVRNDSPQSGWTRTRYGADITQAPIEAFSINGVGHSLPQNGMVAYATSFLGLNSVATPPSSAPPSPSSPPSSPPPGGGSCTATLSAGSSWTDRYNLAVAVTGTNNWIVTMTMSGPARVLTTWNINATWSSSGAVMTARPNGNGNNWGVTIKHNGNRTWPTVICVPA